MGRLLKWLFIGVLVVAIGVAAVIGPSLWRIFVGAGVYETEPPSLPADLPVPAILVFSKTNGFRHDDAIAAGNAAIASIARTRGWGIVQTENGAVFNPDDLARFAATIWNNTSGDILTDTQKQAFRRYIEEGGGFVGVHGAGGDLRVWWPWYVENLIGAQFIGHPMAPQFQQAIVRVEAPNDPAMTPLPAEWPRTDEWYSFRGNPRTTGARVLATIDERTYRPRMFLLDISMGADHPIVWKRCVGRGRAFYSAMGHTAASYEEPLFAEMLDGAIGWAAGLAGEPCAP